MTGRERATRFLERLSDRDVIILDALREYRLMTGAQLRRLLYPDGHVITAARKTRAALQRLSELGAIVRLNRRIGGVRSGSEGHVIGLSGRGHAALAVALGTKRPQRHRRVTETKLPHQDHVLAVSELAVQLYERERAGLCSVEEIQAEPGCWRHYSGIGGERRTLKPDLFVQLGVDEYVQLAFIEMDLGTESPATISRKLGAHVDYWRSGMEINRYGAAAHPRVWWVVPDIARLKVIARAIQRLPATAQTLFTAVLADEAAQQLTQLPGVGGSL